MTNLKFVDQHNLVAYLEKSDDNTEFHQIVDFLSSCSITFALTVSPTIYASYIEQFRNTASSKTVNYVKQIHAIVDGKAVVISESLVRSDILFDDEDVDGKAVVISESLVRSDILFDDEDGITCLTNDEIFENLSLMAYEPLSTKLTFQKDTGGRPRREETMGGTFAQETEISTTKVVYNKAFITLTNRVKKLKSQLKQNRSKAVIHSSNEEGPSVHIEDSPKQGMIIKEMDKHENINLVSEQGKVQETAEHLRELAKEEARQEQERYNLEKALELQRQLDQKKEIVPKGDQAKEIDWNDHQVLRYHALQNIPFSKVKVRKNMIMYLKNQRGYKQSYFKGMKYEDIRPLFERIWD
nr:hypothetical protein [Tanacetum cinerariifolium]